MKRTLILCILFSFILLFGCKKDDSTSRTGGYIVGPGTITSAGDTTYVESANLTYRITRSSPCSPSNEVFYFEITNSTYSNVTYKWDFGDGGTATGTNVQHLYQYIGVFTVYVKVLDASDNLLQQLTASVKPYGQYVTPTASFGSQLNNYLDPNYVAFNAQSSVTNGSIVNYFWEWQDGKTSSVATSYTEHRFPEITKDSTYPVKLTVTSNAGCTSSTVNRIWVPASYNNVGGITYSKTAACAPDSQVFTFMQDTVGLPANTVYEWKFGDETGIHKGNPVKQHFTYSKTYSIVCTIKIVDANGNSLKEVYRNTSVYALGSDINPTAYINRIDYLNPPTNDDLKFDGWGKVGDGHIITNLYWSFGDGATDSTNTPYAFHHYIPPYPANKTYNVTLTVVASSGCIDSITVPVKVNF